MNSIMSRNLSITIKLVITMLLAIMGIMYILEKSPVSEIRNYEKTEMPRPSYRSSGDSYSSNSAKRDSDEVSLTGKSGSYDEVRIGK